MSKAIAPLTTLLFTLISSLLFADCCQSFDVSVGWRRDSLDWKLKRIDSPYYYSEFVNSHINFKDINMYTINGEGKWVGSEYYIRCKADYGSTFKGRAHENFFIDSPVLWCPVRVHTSDPIKRRSEAYDFNAAVGYPFLLCCNRLSVVPLIGFAFNRQHLRVKGEENSSGWEYSFDGPLGRKRRLKIKKGSARKPILNPQNIVPAGLIFSSHAEFNLPNSLSLSSSGSSFSVESHNPFRGSFSSNPFSSPSESGIASHLGLSNDHRTSTYRFTWYGFYLGTDIAYALDSNWTLFTELEAHFLDRCHRKRKSWTGVYYIDDHHKEGWAYGFDGVFGLTYALANYWYTTLSVDYKWWKSNGHHDNLQWDTVGVKWGLGYQF